MLLTETGSKRPGKQLKGLMRSRSQRRDALMLLQTPLWLITACHQTTMPQSQVGLGSTWQIYPPGYFHLRSQRGTTAWSAFHGMVGKCYSLCCHHLIQWPSRSTRLLLDRHDFIIGVLLSMPRDEEGWNKAMEEAVALLRKVADKLSDHTKDTPTDMAHFPPWPMAFHLEVANR